eukprot:2181173-Rhodomonas_salina.1
MVLCDVRYSHSVCTGVRTCYALSGTGRRAPMPICYARATRCPLLRSGMLLPGAATGGAGADRRHPCSVSICLCSRYARVWYWRSVWCALSGTGIAYGVHCP